MAAHHHTLNAHAQNDDAKIQGAAVTGVQSSRLSIPCNTATTDSGGMESAHHRPRRAAPDQFLIDKHFNRKDGKNADYGQR